MPDPASTGTPTPIIHLRLVPYTPPSPSSAPTHHTHAPSLRFSPQTRHFQDSITIKIGRFTDRHAAQQQQQQTAQRSGKLNQEDLRFRSKVVSRHHAELSCTMQPSSHQPGGVERALWLQDTASSSGTFLNGVRMSPQGMRSEPRRLHDGDIIQLGVEYRGGEEEVYRCVRMRVELDRPLDACKAYRVQALASITGTKTGAEKKKKDKQTDPASTCCCICLLPLRRTPLMITTCMHVFHYGCIRPLLKMTVRTGGKMVEEDVDGFSCPMCRTYVDLNAEAPDEEEEDEEDEEEDEDNEEEREEAEPLSQVKAEYGVDLLKSEMQGIQLADNEDIEVDEVDEADSADNDSNRKKTQQTSTAQEAVSAESSCNNAATISAATGSRIRTSWWSSFSGQGSHAADVNTGGGNAADRRGRS